MLSYDYQKAIVFEVCESCNNYVLNLNSGIHKYFKQ